MSVLAKIKQNSRIKETSLLSESLVFRTGDCIDTGIPMLNVALSGSLHGGLTPGLTVLAGPSKHFKSSFALVMAAAYLAKYPEAALLFYDTEFGATQAYFERYGVDPQRVVHTPVKNIEELKFDIVSQLEALTVDDRVVIVIDSVGNIASKKEVEDALAEKSVADMSRAKAMKSLFRIVTPFLKLLQLPLLAVNHTYDTQEMFSKKVVSGGTGIYYSSDRIFIIGRAQEKKGAEVTGYQFKINVDKSRFVKEKSMIPVAVSWDGGIDRYSGLVDVALESGHVTKPKPGWYAYGGETYRLADLYTHLDTLLADPSFAEFIEQKYKV